jgi:hypothetical protein
MVALRGGSVSAESHLNHTDLMRDHQESSALP